MAKDVTNRGVPYFRPDITDRETDAVVECMRTGWLTSGPRTKEFETRFAEAVGGKHAVALNSATAALHLAVHSLGLKPGDGVLVPTHTFAATAEVVQYGGGVPVLVDCDSETLNIDLEDAENKLNLANSGGLPVSVNRIVGIIPVHVAGFMLDMDRVQQFAKTHNLWVVEDAAHAFPAAYKSAADGSWKKPGEATANATCFSFYANKTITTGEGGMLVTDDQSLAESVKSLSLHGLSTAAWSRFETKAKWDYQIVSAGYKYNLTDIASSIGLVQLDRAEELRSKRQTVAEFYYSALADCPQIQLPPNSEERFHSWHLFIIQLRLENLCISRNEFCDLLKEAGIGFSVHWRPLHLHPLYRDQQGWEPSHLPVATKEFDRIVSLPIFAGMAEHETQQVVDVVRRICERSAVQDSITTNNSSDSD